MGDRALDAHVEIGIHPGVPRRRLGAAEGHERLPELQKIIDPRVHALGVGDDQRVGDAALGHAPQGGEAVLASVLDEHREIESTRAEPALEPVEHREKDRVDQSVVGARRHDHRDEVGSPAPEAATGLIGRIAELSRRLQHALAGLVVDVAAIVQRTGHRPDRQAEMTGEFADSDHIRNSSRVTRKGRAVLPTPCRFAASLSLRERGRPPKPPVLRARRRA